MAPSSRVIAAEESTVSVLGTVYPFTAICVVLSWLLVAGAFFLLARGARRRGERAVAVVSWIVAALAAVLAPIQFLYVGAGLVFNVVFFRFGSLAENSPYIDWAYVATVTLLCAALLRRGVVVHSKSTIVSGVAGLAAAALTAGMLLVIAWHASVASINEVDTGLDEAARNIVWVFVFCQVLTAGWMLAIAIIGVTQYRTARQPIPGNPGVRWNP